MLHVRNRITSLVHAFPNGSILNDHPNVHEVSRSCFTCFFVVLFQCFLLHKLHFRGRNLCSEYSGDISRSNVRLSFFAPLHFDDSLQRFC